MSNNIDHQQKKESAVDFVINNIKKLLLSKELRPGDLLPSEMELAAKFNVSRGSIREAMKILSAFGIVKIRRGDGTYVSDSIQKVVLDPFLFNLILSNADTREMVELRELMEVEIIKLIIKNASDADLKYIENIHHEMRELLENNGNIQSKDLVLQDFKFHVALGRATRNILVEKIYEFILELFVPFIEKTYDYEKNGSNAHRLHEDIINALKARDLEQALTAIQRSIEEWRRLFSNDH